VNLLLFKSVKEELMAVLAKRERNPFPIFLRAWLLTMLPFLSMCILLSFWPHLLVLWLMTALVAGFVQNGLGLLMHEGSHYFLHRSKKANDLWANILVCLPIFNTVQGYRIPHFEHHRSSGDDSDPYYFLYGSYPNLGHLLSRFLMDLLGVSALQRFFGRYFAEGIPAVNKRNPAYSLPVFLVIQLVIWLLLYCVTGRWYAWLLLWIVPLMTVTIFLNRFRTIVEHYPGFQGITISRTSLTGWLEYLCIAPYGYGHHLEHHLMPQIPYYHLGFVHKYLSAHVNYTENELCSQGYLKTFIRLMRELWRLSKTRVA
jgi:fatty acid desaturase